MAKHAHFYGCGASGHYFQLGACAAKLTSSPSARAAVVLNSPRPNGLSDLAVAVVGLYSLTTGMPVHHRSAHQCFFVKCSNRCLRAWSGLTAWCYELPIHPRVFLQHRPSVRCGGQSCTTVTAPFPATVSLLSAQEEEEEEKESCVL